MLQTDSLTSLTGYAELPSSSRPAACKNCRISRFGISGDSTEFGAESNSNVSLVDAAMPGLMICWIPGGTGRCWQAEFRPRMSGSGKSRKRLQVRLPASVAAMDFYPFVHLGVGVRMASPALVLVGKGERRCHRQRQNCC